MYTNVRLSGALGVAWRAESEYLVPRAASRDLAKARQASFQPEFRIFILPFLSFTDQSYAVLRDIGERDYPLAVYANVGVQTGKSRQTLVHQLAGLIDDVFRERHGVYVCACMCGKVEERRSSFRVAGRPPPAELGRPLYRKFTRRCTGFCGTDTARRHRPSRAS